MLLEITVHRHLDFRWCSLYLHCFLAHLLCFIPHGMFHALLCATFTRRIRHMSHMLWHWNLAWHAKDDLTRLPCQQRIGRNHAVKHLMWFDLLHFSDIFVLWLCALWVFYKAYRGSLGASVENITFSASLRDTMPSSSSEKPPAEMVPYKVHWFRSTIFQVIVVGGVFFCVCIFFSSDSTISYFSGPWHVRCSQCSGSWWTGLTLVCKCGYRCRVRWVFCPIALQETLPWIFTVTMAVLSITGGIIVNNIGVRRALFVRNFFRIYMPS